MKRLTWHRQRQAVERHGSLRVLDALLPSAQDNEMQPVHVVGLRRTRVRARALA